MHTSVGDDAVGVAYTTGDASNRLLVVNVNALSLSDLAFQLGAYDLLLRNLDGFDWEHGPICQATKNNPPAAGLDVVVLLGPVWVFSICPLRDVLVVSLREHVAALQLVHEELLKFEVGSGTTSRALCSAKSAIE